MNSIEDKGNHTEVPSRLQWWFTVLNRIIVEVKGNEMSTAMTVSIDTMNSLH